MNITCSALPDSLLESELFGHERGAFTDARQSRRGLLEQADGGTVFLDEIGDMALPLAGQAPARPRGESVPPRRRARGDIRPDVRVVAATNRDLDAEVARRPLPRGPLLPPAVLSVDRPAGPRTRRRRRRCSSKFLIDHYNREFREARARHRPAALRRAERAMLAGQRARAEQRHRARGAALPWPDAGARGHGHAHPEDEPARRSSKAPASVSPRPGSISKTSKSSW